jgi:heptosyltransferase-3
MEIPDFTGKRPLRYRIDRLIRGTVMRAIGGLVGENTTPAPGSRDASFKKILLVRANYRIGNAVLTLPALAAFRKHFPEAEIDYVGSSLSRQLFENQPLNHHFEAPRRFPGVLWKYPHLIRQLRSNRYDLAVDVSCSQSGLGSFIVGLSGARIRAGCAGKWDRVFNLRIPKLREGNKYLKLSEFLTALHLEPVDPVGVLQFSDTEKRVAQAKLDDTLGASGGATVGVFVGARKLRGKQWPIENFVELISGLRRSGYRVITFLGPEERDMAGSLKASIGPAVPIIFEPSIRRFAALVSKLNLFVCCDSGPMHLACTVGARVVAIFQERDVDRWAPPASVARIVCGNEFTTAVQVMQTVREELSHWPPVTEPPLTADSTAAIPLN